MKKGPTEIRYVYDVDSHPQAVSESDRFQDAITSQIKRQQQVKRSTLCQEQIDEAVKEFKLKKRLERRTLLNKGK